MEQETDAAPEAVDVEQEPTTFDESYVKKLRAEAAKYRTEAKANAEAAERLAKIEESQKSESQRAQEALAAAQQEAESARLEVLRYRVGVAAGLPPEAISRLQGVSEDEIAADAEKLADLLKPAAPLAGGKPTPTLQSGAVSSEETEPTDGNRWLRQAAGRGNS